MMPRKTGRSLWFAAGLLLICAGIFWVQLFGPHFIGIANNGDFGKVAGWLSLAAPDGGESNFLYFTQDYVRSQRNHWQSPYYSSETVLAWVAVHLACATKEGSHFDIRALGAVHAAIFLLAMTVLLRALRCASVAGRCVVAGVAILIFTDVGYAAYLNSFYMDAAALCGMLVLAAAAVWIVVSDEPSSLQVLLYGCAGLLYVTSKTQHAIWALLPAAFLVYASLPWRRTGMRRLALGTAAVLIAGAALELATADPGNRAQALFNQLFLQIGSTGTAEDLRELGVRQEELQYIGQHSYTPGGPASNRQWVEQFYARTGYGRLFGWYLRRPWRTLGMLNYVLVAEAAAVRPFNLSNYRREEGHPAGALTGRFSAWSSLRSGLFWWWPYHVVVWYVLFLTGAAATIRARASQSSVRLAWLGCGVAALGMGQFGVAALADCLETGRHLFMFHVCTDLTICLAVAWVFHRYFTNKAALPRSL